MKKIFILAPDKDAGGVESLYQLVNLLLNLNKNTYIVFDTSLELNLTIKFTKYNTRSISEIEDDPENILIVPEIWTEKLNNYQNVKKAIWWLSVTHNWGKFQDFGNKEIMHFCQSYYAQHYLQAMGCYHSIMLNDYIDMDFSLTTQNKQDIVCYNPAKGKEITEQIISQNKHLHFEPIVNLTRNQTIELLSISKVYIDFGHHPGRDRIPREAAILNNCVITSMLGSARYYGDIPIPHYYKVEDIQNAGNIINDCIINYKERITDFEPYRRFILSQKAEMEMIVKRTFI